MTHQFGERWVQPSKMGSITPGADPLTSHMQLSSQPHNKNSMVLEEKVLFCIPGALGLQFMVANSHANHASQRVSVHHSWKDCDKWDCLTSHTVSAHHHQAFLHLPPEEWYPNTLGHYLKFLPCLSNYLSTFPQQAQTCSEQLKCRRNALITPAWEVLLLHFKLLVVPNCIQICKPPIHLQEHFQ